mmetsp:Transcript_110749/g.319985  ORF Transcript_110749/g.319985 Transcript_110749/m.319985 type:complete len:238 (-) Transcript_110749:148-861(-)|eukprot:CAMPEP_0176060434 /NCGR_PEP_ID=MMETSP0120_2-20121206/30122_1 /TAXON_ID=160619 /ORGANISM="Kryptoperidinium foliaceum, Strain CCMP 1326" /LENGTH=237 /DNA_ID=CAMNT_0017393977 /DNA_START=66 /DNA_END=779 /DNA_ORIENTATION=+
MGQSMNGVATCDLGCAEDDLVVRRKPLPSCRDNVTESCQALESGVHNVVAQANRGGGVFPDSILVNFELLQSARQGNIKGVSEALDKGAWTETRRPLVMKPQRPDPANEAQTQSEEKRRSEETIGMTPLMFASQVGSTECVQRLLKAGALTNAVEEDGWTPLHFAAIEGHRDVCILLLRGNADPTLRNGNEHTPLELARANEHGCPEFCAEFEVLVKGGVAEDLPTEPRPPWRGPEL